MRSEREGPSVGDTVKSRDGDSRDAWKADYYDGFGVVSGYRQATTERPLMSVHWVDGIETEVVETSLVVVEYNEDVFDPVGTWEKLKDLHDQHGV